MYLSTDNERFRNRGAVLLMVLGIILMCSLILVQVIARVHQEVISQGVETQNDALEASAFQTLEIVIGVLAEIQALDGALYGPAQGWGNPLEYASLSMAQSLTNAVIVEEETKSMSLDDMVPFAFDPGIRVDVVIDDASGKFPLNHTSAVRWKLLFEEMEISAQEAALLTDTLLDWIDADHAPRLNGAESGFYQRNDPGYPCRNGVIQDLQELRLIEGFNRLFFDADGVPNDYFRTFQDCVTTLSPSAINYNTASPLVLAVLAEELEFEDSAVIDFIMGPDLEMGTEDDRVLHPDSDDPDLPSDNDGEPLVMKATCRYLTIHISSHSGETTYTLEAVLDTEAPSSESVYPMKILDLQTRGSRR
jgi:general secretion pathway protein K